MLQTQNRTCLPRRAGRRYKAAAFDPLRRRRPTSRRGTRCAGPVSPMALQYPHLNPVALQIGPLSIRWYGLAYITGLILGWRYTIWLARQKRFNGPGSRPTATDLDDFLFWAMAGVLIGGRMGIVLFYQPSKYFADPISIFKVWEGGMSFHGGMIGGHYRPVSVRPAAASISFFQLSDLDCLRRADRPVLRPAGQLRERTNCGAASDRCHRWAMVFPSRGCGPGAAPPPASFTKQATEGLFLFVLLAILAQISRLYGCVPRMLSGLFLIGYADSAIVLRAVPRAGFPISDLSSAERSAWGKSFPSRCWSPGWFSSAMRSAGRCGPLFSLERARGPPRKPYRPWRTDHRRRLYGGGAGRSGPRLLPAGRSAGRGRRFHHRARDQPAVRRADRRMADRLLGPGGQNPRRSISSNWGPAAAR